MYSQAARPPSLMILKSEALPLVDNKTSFQSFDGVAQNKIILCDSHSLIAAAMFFFMWGVCVLI